MFLYLDTLTHAFGHEDALMQSPAPSSWIIPLCLATAAAQAPFQIPKTASSIITVPCIWSHRNSSPRQQVLLGKPNWCSSKAADKEKYQSPLQFSSWYEQEDSWASQLQGQENIHTTATMEQGRGQNQKDPTLFRYGDTPLTDGTVAAGSNRKRHWRSTDRATGQCTRRMRAPWTGRARGCRDPWLACRWWCPIALQSWIRRGRFCESLPVHTHSRIALELIVDPDAGYGDDGLVGLGWPPHVHGHRLQQQLECSKCTSCRPRRTCPCSCLTRAPSRSTPTCLLVCMRVKAGLMCSAASKPLTHAYIPTTARLQRCTCPRSLLPPAAFVLVS
jgi:hypothetical protein